MVIHSESRDYIVEKLKRELIGPDPGNVDLDLSKQVKFENKKHSYDPFIQQNSGEEIIQRGTPTTRYGSAVLYPYPQEPEKKNNKQLDPIKKIVFGEDGEIVLTETRDSGTKVDLETESPESDEIISAEIGKSIHRDELIINSNTPDLSSAHKMLPHSMAVSFQAEILPKTLISVRFTGGRYDEVPVKIETQNVVWWKRRPIEITAKFKDIEFVDKPAQLNISKIKSENTDGLDLEIQVFVRPTGQPRLYSITVMFINRTKIPARKMSDAFAVFQSEFSVRVYSPTSNRQITPYPDVEIKSEWLTDEEQSLELMYRNAKTFAIGHGCAADWDREIGADERAKMVSANHFPIFELPQMTSEIAAADGKKIEISMAKLAGLVDGCDGIADLEKLIDEYDGWITREESRIPKLDIHYRQTAHRHLAECRRALARMRDGLQFLASDGCAMAAFRLANEAMLMQQHRSKQSLRQAAFNTKNDEPAFSRKISDPNLLAANSDLGYWRAFQNAFLLMGLRSAVDPTCTERETVDLLWVSTGGGKTEAYLSLTAFTIFYRRLVDPNDAGTTVFMRYTLRLLTAQQFQRAGSLICAMEILRRKQSEKLGTAPISIGLWLGNDVTPGTRHDARNNLKQLEKYPQTTANKFVLNRCPYCAAELGKINPPRKKSKRGKSGTNIKTYDDRQIRIIGYKHRSGGVVLHCPDPNCEFHDELPIYVTDEQIYANRPSMFIATVDKLAVLAWKPEAKLLFGLDRDGNRIFPPPSLIIQDEDHLLQGPLGSMVALYEAVVDELCSNRRDDATGQSEDGLRPKIIAATATTRSADEQIRALFARTDTRLFPPPELDAGNSFFTRAARDKNDQLLPGRLYIGVLAPGLGSVQNVEVRTYTSLLQAANDLPPEERDAYWTLMVFFGSLKLLGNSFSLFQSSLLEYSLAYRSRHPDQPSRRIKTPLELTGNLNGDEVLAALKKLEIKWTESENRAIDACLCSSIAEVGVDVGRLSLMTVVGQPKSTAQYIQVTGRVGRDPQHPGAVVTIFSPARQRDRSHFEKFRSYHERLYAQVEPMSVTPFSPPALERALHAVITALVRQTGTCRESLTPYPVPEDKIAFIRKLLLNRLAIVAPEMRAEFEKIFDRRINEWRHWEHTEWSPDPRTGNQPALLRSFDRWTDEISRTRSWATPSSMRSVDSESELRITHYYQSLKSQGATEENL